MPVITIFGGAHSKEGEPDYENARALGKVLAESGYMICNGGYGGTMEASARGAKEGGGKTIGVTTEYFTGCANRWIDQEIREKKWNGRLFKLIELGDAYIFFDGGTGTLVELFTVWEMSNKKLLERPLIIFGNQLQDLVSHIRQFPQVIDNPNLVFAGSPQEVAQILKIKSHADTQRF